jgi:lysophospholipase L1-like esterase
VSKKGFYFKKDIMKKILCYGDSNTYGMDAHQGRIDDHKQWPNILQALLSSDYKVAQEGLGGRFAGDIAGDKPYKNGKAGFEIVIRSVLPVEVVVVALGTNDCKRKYTRTATEIAKDLLWYEKDAEEIAKKYNMPIPSVLYILPANFVVNEYFPGDQELRKEAIALMKQSGREYIELNDLELVEDGVHYSVNDHQKVAEIVHQKIQEMGRK